MQQEVHHTDLQAAYVLQAHWHCLSPPTTRVQSLCWICRTCRHRRRMLRSYLAWEPRKGQCRCPGMDPQGLGYWIPIRGSWQRPNMQTEAGTLGWEHRYLHVCRLEQ